MSFQEFLANLQPLQAELISYLDQHFLDIENVQRKMRFKVPFYDCKSWFCYLNPIGADHVELCFMKGVEMKKTYVILDMKGRKMVCGLMMDVNEDIPVKIITEMINYAISLNN